MKEEEVQKRQALEPDKPSPKKSDEYFRAQLHHLWMVNHRLDEEIQRFWQEVGKLNEALRQLAKAMDVVLESNPDVEEE
jgi:hypothetical protein